MKIRNNTVTLALALGCATLSSCGDFTPSVGNNLVMMRPGDIQFKDEIKLQKTIKEPEHKLDVKRFLKEVFATEDKPAPAIKKTKTIKTSK